MRLLYVSHSFPVPGRPLSNVGGMQRVAVGLHRALAAHSEVELDTLVLETSWRWTGARTPGFLLRLLGGLPARVRRHQADVVLFSSMVTAAVTVPLGDRLHRAGATVAVIPVGRDVTLPNPAYQQMVPRIFASVDLILPISRATARECLRRGADADRVHVIPCGVDLPPPLAREQRGASRQRLHEKLIALGWDLPDDSLLALSVGRHQERKGFHWFVDEVMPRLPEGTVYLLGGNGPMTSEIERRIKRHGLEERVLLLGQVSEEMLRLLYEGSDVFVMPNIPVAGDIEGFGVVMLEAGAYGLPVLAANLEGIQDVIEDGENGRLLPPGDADAFRHAIEEFHDARVRLEASERAEKYVRERFGWDAIAERYVQILRGDQRKR